MACEQLQNAERYHDSELSPAERTAFESHVATCAECRELLAALGALSHSLRAVAMTTQEPESMQDRIFDAWHAARAVQERGVRRMAGWLTAAAAAVLLIGLVGWPSESRDRNGAEIASTGTAAPETWEVAAVMPLDQSPEDSSGSPDLVQVAQWMATDLSTGVRH